MNTTFISAWREVATKVNATAHAKGWYDSELAALAKGHPAAEKELLVLEDARRIALLHSEASELLEGIRGSNGPSDHIPAFSCAEEEGADLIIRLMDVSVERGWRIAEAVEAKRAFNETRSHRHGGKAI